MTRVLAVQEGMLQLEVEPLGVEAVEEPVRAVVPTLIHKR
jgi:hypothetical protein